MSLPERTTILGLSLDVQESPVMAALEYTGINFIISSVVPIPLAGTLVAVGVLMFGIVGGMAINVISSTLGAYVGLLLTRSCCKPCFLKLLGRHASKWKALDNALIADGPALALLIRVTPLMPLVATNILLSLTSISHTSYCWTTLVGLVPANLPYAYAAQLGLSLYEEFPPRDPVMLTLTLGGLVASILIAVKVGKIARKALNKHGLDDSAKEVNVASDTGSAHEGTHGHWCSEPTSPRLGTIDGGDTEHAGGGGGSFDSGRPSGSTGEGPSRSLSCRLDEAAAVAGARLDGGTRNGFRTLCEEQDHAEQRAANIELCMATRA